jgi:uncharacterized protein (DUF1499 family)
MININNIYNTHPVYPSKRHRERISPINNTLDKQLSKEYLNNILLSDENIKVVEIDSQYYVISGNGRIKSIKDSNKNLDIEVEIFIKNKIM